ncbi:MAG: glycosyltransferase family 4 protein [Candidatus Micrarchaeales archaeon]
MRFGFAYDSAYPWFNGGIEKRRFLIMRALHEAGHEVHLFTMFREGMPGMEFVYKGIHYHCCAKALPTGAMYKNGRRNIRWPLKYAAAIGPIIWKYRFGLLDADAFPFVHIPSLATYAKLTGAKFVVTWHEVWDRKYWEKYLPSLGLFGYVAEKVSARVSGIAIANSSTTKEGLIDTLKVPASRIHLLAAPISRRELEHFTKNRKPKRSDKFIALGRLVPEKRIDMAIRAVAATNARLTVIGSGPEKQKLVALARKLGLGKRIRFAQGLSENTIMTELCESRGLLMFSEREGMSLISVEALALGTPVIIVKSTSLPGEIRKYCTIIDEKRLGDSLDRLMKDKKSILYKSGIPKAQILKAFSAESCVALYTKLAR